MASEMIEKYRENAEIFHGKELCKNKPIELLEEMSLPNNLLPVEEMEEVGINREAGFFWLKLKPAQKYRFPKVGDTFYATEIMGFIQISRLKDLKGVTAEELFLTFTASPLLKFISLIIYLGISTSRLQPAFLVDTQSLALRSKTRQRNEEWITLSLFNVVGENARRYILKNVSIRGI